MAGAMVGIPGGEARQGRVVADQRPVEVGYEDAAGVHSTSRERWNAGTGIGDRGPGSVAAAARTPAYPASNWRPTSFWAIPFQVNDERARCEPNRASWSATRG